MLTFCETMIWFLSVSEDPYLFKMGRLMNEWINTDALSESPESNCWRVVRCSS